MFVEILGIDGYDLGHHVGINIWVRLHIASKNILDESRGGALLYKDTL